MLKMLNIRTVLLDLDGTLADTAPDLIGALNKVMQEEDLPPQPESYIRPVVSNGALAMVKRGFCLHNDDPAALNLRDRVVAEYAQNIARRTRLFSGMDKVLETIEQRGGQWGVVTNKPAYLTHALLDALELKQRACAIVSGDTLSVKKPDPAPLFHACQEAGNMPEDCIYIGDAERDIEAGKRAGMLTGAALFGYIDSNAEPETWQADYLFANPAEILAWVEANIADH
jgi:phosphoglycolate phosphatase